MNRLIFIPVLILLSLLCPSHASETGSPVDGTLPMLNTAKGEKLEITGTVLSERVGHGFRRVMRDRVLVLKTADESFTLLRGHNKLVVQKIEKFIGKEITVQGLLVPSSKRFPRRGIKVMSFSDKPLASSGSSLTGNLDELEIFSIPPTAGKPKEHTASSTK